MKTIQIKVTIDGVNYLSNPSSLKNKVESAFFIENMMKKDEGLGMELENGNQIYFGSELIKKSIITIIEL